jgi:hypothetical protein
MFLISCSNTASVEEEISDSSNRIVTMTFYTQEPNYDEVHVSYYDYKTDGFIDGVYPFEFDANGDALPLEIVLENYDFRYVNGQAYRNNHSPARLTVEIYIDGELVAQDSDTGDSVRYAVVRWDYDVGF